MVLTGSWFAYVSDCVLCLSQNITDLDLVHDVEAVLISLVGKRDLDQGVDQSVGVVCRSGEDITEVGTRIRDRGVAPEDYKTSDANAFRGEYEFLPQEHCTTYKRSVPTLTKPITSENSRESLLLETPTVVFVSLRSVFGWLRWAYE
jgi:hypothetical protein